MTSSYQYHVVGEECWAFTLKIHPHRLQYRVSIKIFRGQTVLVNGHSPQNCKQTVSMCCDARVQSDAQRSTSWRKTLVNYYASISQPARSGYKCRNIRSGMFLFWNWCNIAEARRTLKKIGQRTLFRNTHIRAFYAEHFIRASWSEFKANELHVHGIVWYF